MSAIEPIADAVTGSLAAHAVERDTGVDASGHTTERACLNCGARLVGDYCHACGQKGHVHRSLSAFGHDLLHGVFHFEGKIWRTLPMLVWRPGELTRRYIDGQRATFVGPLPLFLFCIFLMFAVVSQTGSMLHINPQAVQADVEKGVRHDEQALVALRRDRAAEAAAGRSMARLDQKIAEKEADLALLRRLAGERERATPSGRTLRGQFALGNSEVLEKAYQNARRNPDLLLFKLKTLGYKYSWALIPLSLPLMWLLFPFSRRWHMYDHTVFVTYSLCFMTLLVIAGSLWRLTNIGGDVWLLLVPPFHIYRQLRGAYRLSRGSALWRAVALTVGAALIASLFTLGLLLLGLFE